MSRALLVACLLGCAPTPPAPALPALRADDLALVATDPLTQPLPLVPDAVVLRGAYLPRAALDAKLAAIAAQSNQ